MTLTGLARKTRRKPRPSSCLLISLPSVEERRQCTVLNLSEHRRADYIDRGCRFGIERHVNTQLTVLISELL